MTRPNCPVVWFMAVALALLTSMVTARAQSGTPSADQILSHYVEATGGSAAWQKLSSRISTGTFKASKKNLVGTFEEYEKAPNKEASTLVINGTASRNGFDGVVGWSGDSRYGLRELEGPALDEARRQSDFYSVLDLHQLYSRFAVNGRKRIDGRTAYVLEAEPLQGGADKLYFDTETGLLLRIVGPRHMPWGVIVTQTDLLDYRDIDGVKLPFTMRVSDKDGEFTLQFTEVRHNVAIDDEQFAKPRLDAQGHTGAATGSTVPSKDVNKCMKRNPSLTYSQCVEVAERPKAERQVYADYLIGHANYLSRYRACAGKYPSLTSEQCQSLAQGHIWIGMTIEQVIDAWGQPGAMQRIMSEDHTDVGLLYKSASGDVTIVLCRDGIVKQIED